MKAKKNTRQALIIAAERIFAEDGVNGASLRKIATAAGSANSYAVQYHFGSRDDLVQAILAYRMIEFDARRADIFLQMPQSDVGVQQLLEAMYRPLFEQRDERGCHSYAAFLSRSFRFLQNLAAQVDRQQDTPHKIWVSNRLRECLPHLTDAEFERRSVLGFRMTLEAILCLDTKVAHFDDGEQILAELLVMLDALFSAPSLQRRSCE